MSAGRPARPARALAKAVLLGPSLVRRAAAGRASSPEERWMLGQPRSVRESYAREVMGTGGDEAAAEVWMLRQPDSVRESYIREVIRRR